MLRLQNDYSVSKCSKGGSCRHKNLAADPAGAVGPLSLFTAVWGGPRGELPIHLESAAFVFHMSRTTPEIIGSPRAACSEPVQRFLACPFSQPNPTPQTRGCLKTARARLTGMSGACLLQWKVPTF